VVEASDIALDVLTVAGKVATSPKEALFTGIRLIRSAMASRFAEQLREEWAKYAADGKIRSDYARTDQAQTIFADTLESLADANFDDEQLDLLRRLFLAAASETVTDRNNMLAREYIEVGRTLATGEIRILAAYYRYLDQWAALAKQGRQAGLHGVNESMDVLRTHTGLTHVALIERHERSLIEKGLVRPQRSGHAEVDQRIYRLTDFGFAFCEFLKAYDRMKDNQPSADQR
jgi:hypothetical protein